MVEPLRLLVPLGYADDAEVSVRQLFLNHVEPLLASRNLWTVKRFYRVEQTLRRAVQRPRKLPRVLRPANKDLQDARLARSDNSRKATYRAR